MLGQSLKVKNLFRFIPLLLLLIALSLFFYFDLQRYLSFEMLSKHRNQLIQWTEQHFFIVSIVYIGIYISSIAISIPGATFLTIIGGFLFGNILGTIYVVISATCGATLIFLATRTALADLLLKKAGPLLAKFEKGFKQNAFSYLLFLRLVPLFPFWLINIVPGLLNIRLRIFFIATLLGIIPGSAVYVSLGNGLGELLNVGQTPDLSIIFKPSILLPLIALGILSLVPIVYKLFKKKSS